MKRALSASELEARSTKLLAWLEWVQGSYDSLLSRDESSSATLVGFDPKPSQRPCECLAAWKRGRLCLACNNTKWRPLTPKERHEGQGVDPYSLQLPVTGWSAVESESGRKAASQAAVDDQLRKLRAAALVRAGVEARPDRALGLFLRVERKPTGFRKVVQGLQLLADHLPHLYDDLPSARSLRACVILMHRVVGGRFPQAPDF